MAEADENELVTSIRRLVETIDIGNVLTEPLTRSIDAILRLSAAELNCDEASVLVRDGDDGALRFLTAIGQVADRLRNIQVPAGKGIAGFVFSSGQPMAVSDVAETDNFYAEVDRTTGFSTQMILATPLRYSGEVIGVLEYVNRLGEPPYNSFTPGEMDRAALYADAVASVVNAYESAKVLRDLGGRMAGSSAADDTAVFRKWLARVRSAPEHREMMDLALLIRSVAARGEADRRLCREVLEAVAKFNAEKDDTSFLV